MRIVLDTNVILAAFLWDGPPRRLLALLVKRADILLTSRSLLRELETTLEKRKLIPVMEMMRLDPGELLTRYVNMCSTVHPLALTYPGLRDPDDIHVLACAATAKADLIVTGDHDLLVLKRIEGIDIVTPAAALVRLNG